jgi:hypothetical protein
MARFDWDAENRKVRTRKHGSIPVWADPAFLSFEDGRRVSQLLGPLRALLNEYELMSRTQRGQRASEFAHRLRQLKREAVAKAGALDNVGARESVGFRAESLIERFHVLSRGDE